MTHEARMIDDLPAARQQSMLKLWLPTIAWSITLFVLSTSLFSASNTSKFIVPILQFLLPGAPDPTIMILHGLIRKAAHFANYGILFWILIHGPMAGRPYAALMLCVCYAFFDEAHQILVPGRTPSLFDVALDSSGALFGRFLNEAAGGV
jgi:VanZ family protein